MAQVQRDNLVEKDTTSSILPEPDSDGLQETMKAIDDIGEDDTNVELVDDSTAKGKADGQEDCAFPKHNGPDGTRQLLRDAEKKASDFEEAIDTNEGKEKDDGLEIRIMLDGDEDNDLDTSKKDTKEDGPETEEE